MINWWKLQERFTVPMLEIAHRKDVIDTPWHDRLERWAYAFRDWAYAQALKPTRGERRWMRELERLEKRIRDDE